MYNLTCMISVAEFDKWSVYSSKIVPTSQVASVMDQWKADMNFLGWEYKFLMEKVELVTH